MVLEVYRGWAAAVQDALPAIIPLGIIGVWRWAFFLFRVVGFLLYKPRPPTYDNKYRTTDVTLIIPTIDTDEEAMHEAMRSWFLNEPYEIIIVTAGEDTQKELQRIASTSVAASITRVLRIDKPHKRFQLVHGIKAAETDLCCFTDDDAIWNANFLKWLLVPFDDPKMGGTGSSQIMRPNDLTKPPTVFERIADMRLSGRMLEACASTFYDGSVSCLSGRTALYHKRILTDNFPSAFCNEKWRNKYPLISGDDKYMTRWLVSHGWKMHMQVSPECTLATTFKADDKFFMQILRWTRNTWRSDFKSLVLERDIWYRYPVQAVLMVDRMVSPFTLMSGPILFIVSMTLIREFDRWTDVPTAVCIWFLWLLISRTCRMSTHFYRCPEDITYLPFFIAYQYYFAYLKLYALFTLHVTSWGTRAGVGGPQDKKSAEQIDAEAKQKARELEEGFINQKARMERKRKMAEKSYWAGDISVMRRMHQHVGDVAHKDEIEWATPLVLPGQSTLAFPVFNDPANAAYMATQRAYTPHMLQYTPSVMAPGASQMGPVPSQTIGSEYAPESHQSNSTGIAAKAQPTEGSSGSSILAEKQKTATLKKKKEKLPKANSGSSSSSGSLTFQPAVGSIGDRLSEAGGQLNADALYCMSREASQRSRSGAMSSPTSSPSKSRKQLRSQSSLARSSASPTKPPMKREHSNRAQNNIPKAPSPSKSGGGKSDDLWDVIDRGEYQRSPLSQDQKKNAAENDKDKKHEQLVPTDQAIPGNSSSAADTDNFSPAGISLNPEDAKRATEPESQSAGLSFK